MLSLKRGKPTGEGCSPASHPSYLRMRRLLLHVCLVGGLWLLAAGCAVSEREVSAPGSSRAQVPAEEPPEVVASEPRREGMDSFELRSDAFADQAAIPVRYGCDGENNSPPLGWGEPPEGTVSYTLVFDDPDAVDVVGYTWVHWILFNLPASTGELSEGISIEVLPNDTLPGSNSWDRKDYGGPCPPAGTHRYIFTLYALDEFLDLEAGATSEELRLAMQGHILGEATLAGSYTR